MVSKRGGNNAKNAKNTKNTKRRRITPTPTGDPNRPRQRRIAASLAQRAVQNALAQRLALAAFAAKAMRTLAVRNSPKGLGTGERFIKNRNGDFVLDPVSLGRIPRKRAVWVQGRYYDENTVRGLVRSNPINPLTRQPLPRAVQNRYRGRIPYDLWDEPADSDFDNLPGDIRDYIASGGDDEQITIAVRKLWSAALTLGRAVVANRATPATLRQIEERYDVTIQLDGEYYVRSSVLPWVVAGVRPEGPGEVDVELGDFFRGPLRYHTVS